LPLAVQRRCVQIQLMGLGLKPEFDLIEKLRRCPETAVEVGIPAGETSGRRVQRDVSGLVQWVSEMSSVTSFSPACLVVDLSAGAGEVVFDGVEVTWRISLTKSGRPPKKKLGEEFFDADQLGNAITLRHWQRGDRFMPIGMRNALKLQDFFVNQRVPRPRRHELALATAAAGEVFWVEGMRIAEGFKVTAATNRRLHWIWRRR
jgi:tRNA(Ile)-lysidine synthase